MAPKRNYKVNNESGNPNAQPMNSVVRRKLRPKPEVNYKSQLANLRGTDPLTWKNAAYNDFVEKLPNSLKFTEETKYEFMFNILDTVHDIFDDPKRVVPELFSMFGVGTTKKTLQQQRHGLTEFVFGIERILKNNKSFKPLLRKNNGVENSWKTQSFEAKNFREFWLKYLYKPVTAGSSFDLSIIKKGLIDNIKELGIIRSYTFHSQLIINRNTSENTIQEIRGDGVMNDIFTKFTRYYAAVDATKTKMFTSTKLILTPAILLDSANTPDLNYTMLFVDCQIRKNKNYFIVKFNTTSQQMTCKFHVTMLVFQSETVLFKTISERSNINDDRQTFLVEGVTMPMIHESTVLIVSPDDQTKKTPFGESFFLDVSIVIFKEKGSIRNPNPIQTKLKEVLEETKIMSRHIIWQNNYNGIPIRDCTMEIVNWRQNKLKISEKDLTPNTRGLQYMMIQFFLDFKRMGDSYQITYLKAYNKHMAKSFFTNKLIKSNMPFIYFTTQDILAVCQAIGVSDSEDIFDKGQKTESGDATTGLPFLFNTKSLWMMGSNVNHKQHTSYHASQVANQKQNSNRKKQSEQANIDNNSLNRSNFVKETLKLASKVKYLNGGSKNEHEMVYKHFEELSRLTPKERIDKLEEWANANLTLKAKKYTFPSRNTQLDNQGKIIPMKSFKGQGITIANAWEGEKRRKKLDS
jgi:hypothetical protein